MTDLSDLLAPEAVLADLAVGTKRALLGALAAAAEQAYAVPAATVADRLLAREKLGSTGFGGGVALPHAKLAEIGQVRVMVVRLVRPIDYGAVDDLPVDLVAMLLSPEDAGAEHLKALARVSRRLRDPAFTAKLRGAGSRDALYALLAGVEARDAAA